jgi:Ca2+-binding RTX toxin-like protein
MVTYIGSNKSEVIVGSASRDTIRGNGGDDDLYGKDGSDTLSGGAGNDYLSGGNGDDHMEGGAGINEYLGYSGYDRFVMSSRDVGYTDDTILDFHQFVDLIDLRGWGITSFEQVKAIAETNGSGGTVLKAPYDGYGHFLTINDHSLSELNSRDFIFANLRDLDDRGTRFGDVMFGSRYGDRINGAGGNDQVIGGLGNDRLNGGEGNDHLQGGSGRDTLTGDAGRDRLEGGTGADIFRFVSANDTAGDERDLILDFLRDYDQIDVSEIDADTTKAGNQSFEFAGNSIFTGIGQLIFSKQGQNTVIAGNIDADTIAEFQIVISGIFSPRESDFIL